MSKQRRWEMLFVIVAVICTLLTITSGEFFKQKVELQIGQIAPEDVYAPVQIENEVATQQKRLLAQQSIPNVYTIDRTVLEDAIQQIRLFFQYCHAIIGTEIAEYYNVAEVELLQNQSPIPLYSDDYNALLEMSVDELYALEQTLLEITTNILNEGIREDTSVENLLKEHLDAVQLTNVEEKVSYEIISSQLRPNVMIDEVATQIQKDAVAQAVEPIYILQGERIIGQGDRVTEENYALLAKMGYLESDEHKGYVQYVGVGLFSLLMLFLVISYLDSGKELGKLHLQESSLIFMLYVVSLGVISIFDPTYFVFLPLSTAPLLIAIFIGKDLAMIIQFILIMVSTLTHKGDYMYMLYFISTGLVSIPLADKIQQRKGTVRNAVTVGGLYGFIYLTINLAAGIPTEIGVVISALQAFLVGGIQVILIVGSIPLWEVGFGFVTPSQLLELTNPDQPILKKMLIEATGTYYHSLLVANLAEAAADEIGANPLLARVGGYYHDIGKLNCSNYFKENQVVENPHDYMEPTASAKVIISHATSGIELADTYKLPQCVKDMIIQHHGTGIVQYFYVKAQKDHPDVMITDFKYPGPKPQTKEAALIMLADVVEATVRAMQSKIGVEVTVEQLVRKMVKQKLDEGQLDECPLYISDIEKIIGSFSKMLKGMYHERIEYPDKKG